MKKIRSLAVSAGFHKPRLLLAVLLVLVTASCTYPSRAITPAVPAAVDTQSTLSTGAPQTDLSTPTPFQVTNPDPALPTPIPVERTMPQGQINWLVLGSDYRPKAGYRTDVIILVSINPSKGTVSLISFPRDLYVTIPGWTTNRINTAQPHGGFPLMQDTFSYNLGIKPDHYIMTNFDGFKGIIDSLGGVDVHVGKTLTDHCDLPQAIKSYCTVTVGTIHMDGPTALWYVRSRYSTSDFERLRRSQEVLSAVFTRMIGLNAVSRLPELYAKYKNSVETDLTLEDMAPLLSVAAQIAQDPGRVKRFTIAPPAVHGYITKEGADVQIPDYEKINQILDAAVFNP